MSEIKREFHITGDYIENQTNHFYDHSQYNSTGAVMQEKSVKSQTPASASQKHQGRKPEHPAPHPQRKSSLPKLKAKPSSDKPRERMTFTKRGIQEAHIRLLFHHMIELDWVTRDTRESDFLDLFSGELSDCQIIWSDKFGKSTLVFLFRYLETEGVISVPKGYSIPNILMGHFVDREGEFLTNLDKGDKPNDKAGVEIMEFIQILKIQAGRQGRRAAQEEDLYDDAINPYTLSDEGLHLT